MPNLLESPRPAKLQGVPEGVPRREHPAGTDGRGHVLDPRRSFRMLQRTAPGEREASGKNARSSRHAFPQLLRQFRYCVSSTIRRR